MTKQFHGIFFNLKIPVPGRNDLTGNLFAATVS
jgi:hypothetical protein